MTISPGTSPRKTLVKICGGTTPEQALACVAAGADWIGLNGWPKSRRFIPLERMRELTQELPDGVTMKFPIDGFSKKCLLMGIDQLAYIMSHEDEISDYEKTNAINFHTTKFQDSRHTSDRGQ